VVPLDTKAFPLETALALNCLVPQMVLPYLGQYPSSQQSKRENLIESEPHTWLPTEDFESCSRRPPSVTMGHIPRECGRLSGGLSAILTHENRYSPIEQAKSGQVTAGLPPTSAKSRGCLHQAGARTSRL
jgi:hypothetical protein